MQSTAPEARLLACYDVTVIASPSPNRGTIRYKVWEPGRDQPLNLTPRGLTELAAEYSKREPL